MTGQAPETSTALSMSWLTVIGWKWIWSSAVKVATCVPCS